MLRRLLSFVLLAGALFTSSAPRAFAYSLGDTRWTSPSATLHLQLGATSAPLTDGSASWAASAEDAIAIWNQQLKSFRFEVTRDSTAAKSGGNRINNVFFAADVYGEAWGSGVLAVTYTYSSRTANVETDVLFNNRLNWNSYRGPQQRNSAGQAVHDFHRVALHEFGHALGLDHPDEAGQSVSALMNSRITSLDTLTTDDITGAQTLYGAAADTPTATAPVITTQPASRTVIAGQSTTFTVVASSTTALSYQWAKAGAPLAAATTSSYTIAVATTADAGSYAVTVTNTVGSVTSAAATLTVTTPSTPTGAPQIVSAPASQSVAPGQPASFSVTASGTAPFTYQWRRNGGLIAGATSATHAIASVQASDVGSYTATVSNALGSVTSPAATLSLNAAPAFTTHPVSQTVALGTPFTLVIAATGSPAPRYQWHQNGTILAGATAATYAVAAARASDAGTYTVTASNVSGAVTSNAAVVTISTPPVIASPPVAQTVNAGQRVQFSIITTPALAVAYQWFHDGTEIPGATGATLLIDFAQPAHAGHYTVRVSNAHGATLSAAAELTVRYSRLVNLSTRGYVPPGGTLTPGFYVRGTKPKPLLIRAVGPTLATFGVDTALSEAALDVIAQATSTVVATNSDWGGSPALRNAFASVGAFPLAADSKDAAVQADFAPAGYSVRIAPANASLSGVTLAEIYDAGAASTFSQLVNVSTLGFVGTGENILTAGFVISGNTPKRVLVRAIGPGLVQFGVPATLADPQLGLVPLGQSEPLAANDDWPDTAELRTAFTTAAAFPLTGGSKDAALVITLAPGAYTALVSSATGGVTGTALVEIYDLDP